MTADILAGGLGTRISEETHLKPKTNLWHILKIYSDHRINEFVICCGYKMLLISMEKKASNQLNRRVLFASRSAHSCPALFLDRDGVIIEDCHYIKDPDLVQLCGGVSDLIVAACRLGYAVVVVTNQSGIARGLLSWEQVEAVNQRMLELLGPEAKPSALYANGYGPDAAATSWRKPSPAMLLDAAQQLNLDLNRSVMIGDRLSDIQAGVAAGVALVCHVLSGHGRAERTAVQNWHQKQQAVTDEALSRLRLLDGLQGFDVNQLIMDQSL